MCLHIDVQTYINVCICVSQDLAYGQQDRNVITGDWENILS